MNARAAIAGVALAALLVTATSGAAWWWRPAPAVQETAPEADLSDDITPLPVPPVPPRVAQGDEYEACLAQLKDDPAAATAAARAWQAKGGGEGAAHCLALAEIAGGSPDRGAGMLEELARGSTGSAAARASVYGQAGQAWLMAGDVARAFAAATLALSLSPDDPDLLTDRAVTAGNLGRFQDAIDDLTRALELDPQRYDAMVLRGSAWRHLGRLERAGEDVERVLAADSDDAEALLERGILRQRANDFRGARRDWERAEQLAADTATADLAEQNLALLDAGPDRR